MLAHRSIAFFYRAWVKHRPIIGYEWAARRTARLRQADGKVEKRTDDYSRYVLSLLGLGTPALQQRLAVDDQNFVYYAGLFAQRRRPAGTLRALLADYFQLSEQTLHIEQFLEQVLPLPQSEQTELGEWNCDLGVSTVIGDAVEIENAKFRIVLGPLALATFRQFLPPSSEHRTGERFRRMVQLTRLFVGPELDFDIRLLLKKEEAYGCQLGGDSAGGTAIGVAAWLVNDRDALRDDLADSIFPSELAEAPRPLGN